MTRLSDILDAEAVLFEEQNERITQFYERAAGIALGRKPWSWASLPGLDPGLVHIFFPSGMRLRSDDLLFPLSIRGGWLMTKRIDGGREGLVRHMLADIDERLTRGGIVKATLP